MMIAIVTGSNSGVGFQTALALVKADFHVILACRSEIKGLEAKDAIMKGISSECKGKAEFMALDLSSFESVRQFVKAFNEQHNELAILVNNGGLNYGGITKDGYDFRWQVNYLSHFLLTKCLLPNLFEYQKQCGTKARVVSLSSVMHRFGKTDWENQSIAKHTSPYSSSKLAMNLLSLELDKRYGDKIIAVAVNPGFAFTDIWRKERGIVQWLYSKICLTPEQAAHPSVHACTSDSVKSGEYYTPYWVPRYFSLLFESHGLFAGPTLTQPAPIACDSAVAAELWKCSEAMIDVKG